MSILPSTDTDNTVPSDSSSNVYGAFDVETELFADGAKLLKVYEMLFSVTGATKHQRAVLQKNIWIGNTNEKVGRNSFKLLSIEILLVDNHKICWLGSFGNCSTTVLSISVWSARAFSFTILCTAIVFNQASKGWNSKCSKYDYWQGSSQFSLWPAHKLFASQSGRTRSFSSCSFHW